MPWSKSRRDFDWFDKHLSHARPQTNPQRFVLPVSMVPAPLRDGPV